MTIDHSVPSCPASPHTLPPHRVTFIESDSRAIPDYFYRRGTAAMPGRTLLLLHGISRNAAELAARFAAAEQWDEWTLIAPIFEKKRFGQYQQALARPGKIRSDDAITALIGRIFDDEGLSVPPVHIFGFSGGAQLAHRYAMLHPRGVAGVYAMAAGWYLMPDADLPYPYGLAERVAMPCLLADALRVPIVAAVGALDTRCDNVVRQEPIINQKQGRNRRVRAQKWQKAMNDTAARMGINSAVSSQLIANGTHNFGQCAEETDLLNRVHAALA